MDPATAVARFRLVLLTYAPLSAITAATWWFPPLRDALVEPEEASLINYNWEGAVLVLPPLTWLLLFALVLATLYGMYTFSRHARLLFALLAAFGFVTGLLGGTYVVTPVVSVLSSLMSMLTGAILALAYISPLSSRFTE